MKQIKERILLLFPHMVSPGGALNYTLRLAELLLKRGATVAIVTMQADRNAYGVLPGLEIISLNGPLTSSIFYWLLLPYWQMKINWRLRIWKPDVIVAQVFPSNWWGWLGKCSCPETPLIWVCHEPSAFIHSEAWISAIRPAWKRWIACILQPLLAWIDTSLCKKSDRIVANSAYTAQMVTRIYRRKVDAITYPGIDFSLFRPDNPPVKEQMLITVARLTRFKRVDFLLRVFAQIRKRRSDLQLIIVGEGEEEEALRNMAKDLGLDANVTFTGKVTAKELASLYRKALAYIHGSVEEPFGMAPLEAIASGTPVIAHCSGGPVEFVTSNCGLLIESLSEEQWVQEIENFLARINGDQSYFEQVASCTYRFTWDESLYPLLKTISEVLTAPVAGKRNRE